MFQLNQDLQRLIWSFDPTYKIAFDKILSGGRKIFVHRSFIHQQILTYPKNIIRSFRFLPKEEKWLIEFTSGKTEKWIVIIRHDFEIELRNYVLNHLEFLPDEILHAYTSISRKAIVVLRSNMEKEEYIEEMDRLVELDNLFYDDRTEEWYLTQVYQCDWENVMELNYETSFQLGPIWWNPIYLIIRSSNEN